MDHVSIHEFRHEYPRVPCLHCGQGANLAKTGGQSGEDRGHLKYLIWGQGNSDRGVKVLMGKCIKIINTLNFWPTRTLCV